MSARGKFITLEGIDGAGKSSQLEYLKALVESRGHECWPTREPGGTEFGKRLREVVLNHHASALVEALVMFADRSAHVEADIEPRLAAGTWVLCDRFSDSTYAYQCGGKNLPVESFEILEKLVHPGLQPDATFLFDIDPATAGRRQAASGRTQDEFDKRDTAYFIAVRNAYLERQRRFPRRIHLIDASGSLEQVRVRLKSAFAKAFP